MGSVVRSSEARGGDCVGLMLSEKGRSGDKSEEGWCRARIFMVVGF